MSSRIVVLGIPLLLLAACSRHTASVPVLAVDASPALAAPDETKPADDLVHLPAASLPYLTVEPVALGDGRVTVRAPAKVAFRDGAVASVGPPVAGRVAVVHVQVGDRVAAGDVLVTLASPAAAKARADLARAQAVMASASDHLRRETDMVARGIGLEVERVDAKTKHDQAAAELARATEAVRFLGEGDDGVVTVRAPIAGTILQRTATLGASVDLGTPLVEVGDPSALWIVAEVYEGDLANVRVGAEASVTLATSATPVAGRVVAVGAALEQGLRRAPVYITVDGGSGTGAPTALRPNTYARVAITGAGSETVSVPVGAVLIEDGRRSVVYVEQGTGAFARRDVTVGSSTDADRVQVTAGLTPGERVVVRGALLLDRTAEQLL
jgi:cobalt-zinc-cadmium efflux system membrane fusion protein